ncbi:MAG: PTS sugar transporter subunit IIA [Pseudomonadota bacterium]
MKVEDILGPESVLCNAQARSKKHCLEILSELLARPNPEIPVDEIFEKLTERERLGCTSLDLGVAFPHCRVNGLSNSVGAMIKLSEPVDFDAADGEPVDLIFGLIVPEDIDATHYEEIRDIADMLKGHHWRSNARATSSSRDLYDILIQASQPIVPESAQAAR